MSSETALPPNRNALQCASCGSDNLTAVPHAYRNGVVHTTGKSVSVGAAFSSRGIMPGAAVTETSGVSISQEAQRLAPPPPADLKSGRISLGNALLLLAVISVCGAFQAFGNSHPSIGEKIVNFLVGFAVAAAAGWGGLKLRKLGRAIRAQREAEYNRKLRVWNESWVCNRCGNITHIGT